METFLYRLFSHDVMAAILVHHNKKAVARLMEEKNPPRARLFFMQMIPSFHGINVAAGDVTENLLFWLKKKNIGTDRVC